MTAGPLMSLKINGAEVEAPSGRTVLEVAREMGIRIPTLCYSEALEPYGACRLCSVEVETRGVSRIVASCIFPVEQGLVVRTDTEEVREARRFIVGLLLARSPGARGVQELAEELGVSPSKRIALPEEDCILCGLCVRACHEIVGVGAIDFISRGFEGEAKPPFQRASGVCIGCGTCATICPTGAARTKDFERAETVHRGEPGGPRHRCWLCGNYHLDSECGSGYTSWFER